MKKLIIVSLAVLFVSVACDEAPYNTMNIKGKLEYLRSNAQDADESTKADLKAKLKALNGELTSYSSEIQELKDLLGEAEKRTPVEVTSLARSNFDRYVSLQSVVESDRNSLVSPKMSGVVTAIKVDEGQHVKKGDILVELDKSIQMRRLAQAKNQLSFIKTVYDKQSKVWEQKVGSEIEYLKAKNDYENMTESINLIKEEIEMLNVKAPFSGIVDEVLPKIGEAVAPGIGVIRLVSSTGLQIKVDFAENYITNFKKGDPVDVYFPDVDLDTLTLRINSISGAVNSKKRTISAVINVPSQYSGIKPNMTCITKFNDFSMDSTIVIPLNLVQKSNTEDFVYIAESNANGESVAIKRVVKVGMAYKDKVIIMEGLEEGDILITSGENTVQQGKIINILNQ